VPNLPQSQRAALHADIVVVRGSRHAAPFDSIETTNACILAALSDAPLPERQAWVCDEPAALRQWALACGLAHDDAEQAVSQRVSWRQWRGLQMLAEFAGSLMRCRAYMFRRRAYGLSNANALKCGAPTLG
jgi:hypothetical protein